MTITVTPEQMDTTLADWSAMMRAKYGEGRHAERYHAALNTPAESEVFMQIAAEMDARDDPLWASFYDLAVGPKDADWRADFLAEIEEAFAEGEQ